MKNNPFISIIAVFYNGEKYLEEVVKSVINQTYENVEHVMIGDGSAYGVVDIIKKYENKISCWVSEKDSGISDAFNKGFNGCIGEILYWFNYDDLLVDKDLNIVTLRDFSFHSLGKLMYYKRILLQE